MGIKALALGIIVALIFGLGLGYAAKSEEKVTLTSTIKMTTTATSTTTLTKTLTTTQWKTITVTKTMEKERSATTTTTHTESSKGEYPAVVCLFSDYKGSYKVKFALKEVIRGYRANYVVRSTNMFNKKPPEGYEYALVDVVVTLLEGERFSVNPLFDFKIEAKGRLTGPESIVVLPDNMPKLEVADLLEGGTTSGWLAFLVPEGSAAWLHLEPTLMKSASPCKISVNP